MRSSWFRPSNFSLLFILIFGFFSTHAQETFKKRALKEIILELEESYDIRFSYREDAIQNVHIFTPDSSLNLRTTLDRIEKQSSLEFQMLDERYVAIIKKDGNIDFCGILKDNKTKSPLTGATIENTNTTATFITDTGGNFQIENISPGSFIKIRFLGYEPILLEITSASDTGNCLEILMNPTYESLEETVVINYLTSGISKQLDGSTSIDTERFGTLPGLIEPDALQTVESLPGVESINETVSNINIRGGTSDQNLVLFDDVKMYLTGHFFGLISAFNPALTNQVNLIKNGTSAEYNDGVSGSINIRSRDELTHRLEGGVGFNLVSTDAYFQVPITDKLELQFSGRRSINDLISTPTYNNYYSRTFQDSEIALDESIGENKEKTADFNYYDTSFKALYDVDDRHKLRFSLIHVNNDLEYTQGLDQSSAEERRESGLAQQNIALGGTWTAKWNENFRTKTSSYLTRYNLDALNYTVNSDQRLIQQNEVLESGLKFNANNRITKSIELLNGYQFYEVGVSNIERINNPFYSSRIKNVIRSHSIFSEMKYVRNKTFIRAGVRLNYLEKFDEILVEPRLSFNQKLGDQFSFKAQAEFKSQTTSQIIDLQEDFLGVENRRWILSDNETFPVIKSKQVSTGVDYKANGWYIDVEAFYKKVTGISTSNQGFQNQHEFMRTSGNYVARGFEFLINKKSGNFHTYLTYTIGDNNYNFEELPVNHFPNNFDIRHSASLAANYSYGSLKLSLGGNLRSGKPYTKPVQGEETRQERDTQVVNYADPNAEILPSFFRIDFSSSYKFHLSQNTFITTSLGLLNILNRENIINRYYRLDSENPNNAIQVDNTSLGFTPNALIRIAF